MTEELWGKAAIRVSLDWLVVGQVHLGVEARGVGVTVAKVVADLLERQPLVQEPGGAGVAQGVGPVAGRPGCRASCPRRRRRAAPRVPGLGRGLGLFAGEGEGAERWQARNTVSERTPRCKRLSFLGILT